MKIEDQGAFEVARAAGVNPVQRTGPVFHLFGAYGVAPTPGADSASLSAQAQELRNLTSEVKALPDIREDKLAALESSMANGTWQVSVDDLSEAMFRLAELDHQA